MPQSVGSIILNLGLNTAPLSTQIKTASAGVQTQLNSAFKGVSQQATKAAGGIGAKFASLFSKLGGMMATAFALGRIKALAQEWQSLFRTQMESEIKIAITMRNATNATMEQIQAVKNLASEYQQIGVIGDEVQLAGMQELATYVSEVESVKKLMPVLNDMVAQQYGYDATGGAAVSLATMIGKVMTGSTTALMRFGYDFTDEQANIIKYGTEAERVATVTEVIEASVANMNEALASTPTGRMKQLSNNFSDMKEALGGLTTNICTPFVSVLNVIVVKLTQAFNALSRFSAALLNIKSFSFIGLGKSADAASGSIDGVAASAGGAGKAIKSLMGFDQLNRLDGSDSGGGSDDANGLPFDGNDFEPLDSLAAKVQHIKALFAEGFTIGFSSADLKAIKQHAESVKIALTKIFASDEVQRASNQFSETVMRNLGKATGAAGSIGATLAENLLGGIDLHLHHRGNWLRGQIAELFDIRAETANTAGDLAAAFAEIFSAWKGRGGKAITASIISIMTDAKIHVTSFLSKLGRDVFGALAKPFTDNASSIKATAEGLLRPIGDIFMVMADAYHDMCGALQAGYDSIVKPVFKAIGETLSKLWAAHLQPMWGKVGGFLSRIAEFFKAAWNKAQPLVKTFTAMLAVLGKLLAPIVSLFGSQIIDGLGQLADAIGMVFDVLSGLLDFVTGVFTGDWDRAWRGVRASVAAVWSWLKSSLTPMGSMFASLWNGVRTGASAAWSSVKSNAEAAWSSMKTGASAAWGGIKSVFSSVASFFESTFRTAWEKVKAVFSTGGQIFSGIKDGIVSSFKAIVNKIISGINTVVAVPFNSINSALNKIRNFSILKTKPFSSIGSISVPKIPLLAHGGYVKANTPQLAMIGDNRRYGEIVAPEDKMLEMIMTALKLFRQQDDRKPQPQENQQLMELVVNLGDETLIRRIIKLLREEGRRGNYEFSF